MAVELSPAPVPKGSAKFSDTIKNLRSTFAFHFSFLGIVVAVVGLAVLVGWEIGYEPLTKIANNLAAMAPSTALNFVLAGTALALHSRYIPKHTFRGVQLVLCGVVVVMSALVTVGHIFEKDFDFSIFLVSNQVLESSPAQMSFMTALCFVLVGAAVALIAFYHQTLNVVAGALAVVALLISLFAIIGYVLDAEALYSLRYFESMALHTAVAFFLLATGTIAVVMAANWHAFQNLDSDLIKIGFGAWCLIALTEILAAIFLLGSIDNPSGELLALVDAKTIFVLILAATFIFAGATIISMSNANRRDLQERIESILNSTAEGIYGIDTEGKCNFANDACLRLLGFDSVDEFLGHNVHHLVHHQYSDGRPFPLEECPIYKSLATRERVHIEDGIFWRKDGESIPVEYWSYPLVRDDEVVGSVVTFFDVSARKLAEETRELLLGEVNHRAKNLLAVVQSVAKQTARESQGPEFAGTLIQRLQGLSASQDLIIKGDWMSVSLSDLAKKQLSHLGERLNKRCHLEGPFIYLKPQAAQGIGMAFHELATNSMKYGALSNDEGTVGISWEEEKIDNVSTLKITWSERGGPRVNKPTRRGFGSTVVERMAAGAVNGKVDLDYKSEGLKWSLTAPSEFATSSKVQAKSRA